MSINLERIEFGVDLGRVPEDAAIATVRGGLVSELELHQELVRVLRFPEYYGYNWNALWDFVGTLFWLDERVIVLVHEDVPNLPDDGLAIYLDILHSAIISWDEDEGHDLRVVFPEFARARLAAVGQGNLTCPR